jgi:hypothetical protein
MTGKEKLFVNYYLGEARCNASQAARLAGYSSPGQTGHTLLKKTEIQTAISERTADVAAMANEVLRTLADHMRGPTAACFGEDGELDPAALRKAGLLHLVRKTRRDKDGNLTIELYDAQAAAVQLGKHHGVLEPDGGSNVTVLPIVYVNDWRAARDPDEPG